MIATILGVAGKNPLVTVLVLLVALFAGLAGWQKLEAIALEIRVGKYQGTIAELRGSVALHHAEAEALSGALSDVSREVERWQAEAEKRRQASERALEEADKAFAESEERLTAFRALEGDACEIAVGQVREVWDL